MTFSEATLGLKPKWFTGAEWSNGIAEVELQIEYEEACARKQEIEDAKTPEEKMRDERKRKAKRFQQWFKWSLTKEG